MKETSLRLTVECVDGRSSSLVYDVGPAELELLMIEHGSVNVVHWGRYAVGCWACGGDEHERILEAMRNTQ